MIPKVIHYCWFGGNDLPDDVKKCIDSWKKFMPDYEIKRWDETNYDINKCDYIREAYEEKKWAFVSDYARIDICYTYGGIYLDTDVEVLKSFDDLLNLDAFCGREQGKKNNDNKVNTGLVLGMKKNSLIGKIMRDDYNNKHFRDSNGKLDLTPCPVIQTNLLKKYGLNDKNVLQVVNGLTIFPTDYFCPMNQYTGKKDITDNTYSIHHYNASWVSDVDKNRRELRKKYSKYGKLLSNVISTFVAYKNEYGIFKMWKEIIKKIGSR